MKSKIFKLVITTLIILFAASSSIFAQVSPVSPDAHEKEHKKIDTKALKSQLKELKKQLKNVYAETNEQVTGALKDLNYNISAELTDISPLIDRGNFDYNDNATQNGSNEKTRNYTKSYPVDANDVLVINNSFGKVTVNTWDKNEFKVDVQIKTDADNDSEAQRTLDNVTISDSKNGSEVVFKTNIGHEHEPWLSLFGGHRYIHKMEINYTVYMPAKNALTVDNSYGAIVVPDMAGKVTIRSAYGSFKAQSLTNQNNIVVTYGSANIMNLGSAKLKVAYGSLKLGSASTLEADIAYSSANIDKINVSGNIKLAYSGGLKIADIDRNLKDLTIKSAYSDVKLGLSDDESANFDVTTNFGGFDHGSNVTITSKTPDDNKKGPHFTKNYKGYTGKGGSDRNITLNISYGNIKFINPAVNSAGK